ncbi:FecCD family ABC transporter permease [Mammaliicoccus sciuri]|uniref:FecCD family ABC transporter permease n=1 Tax=Mammaliicoccus sciuri TaxID=1296 RepID=UPI001FB24108|nr:iron ABC transporter permease [Mammaliicoccus sciuri]MCJ0952296.1 iron ABC transporter permease [Mammaliicoccus sciuri]
MKLKWKYIIVSLVLLISLFINLQVGSQFIGTSKIISTFTGFSDDYDFVVYNYRLPRMIISLIGGALLGVSGAIVQSLLRNPLASPDIIGVTKGAGLFAVAQTLLLPALPFYFLGVASFIGAVVLIMLIMLIGKLFQASTYTIALIGVALSAICQAGLQYFMIRYPDNINTTLLWLSGSVWGRNYDDLWFFIPGIVVLPLIFLFARKIDILSLGDESAVSLGEKVTLIRNVYLVMAAICVGSVVSVTGTIGFIGLIAPHIARLLAGPKAIKLLPLSALIGSIFLLVADAIGKGLFPPLEIPAGVVTAIIGAPYFLYLLKKSQSV